jgi:hypothetical protein
MTTDEEAKEAVTDWLNRPVADFYDKRIIRLVQCLCIYLNHNGDYVEE